MAFVLVISGLLMIVTGARGTYAQFGSQIASDFTGDHNFTSWLLAIGSVGALGYVESLRTVSRMFMALILISMVIANKGFFNQLTAALKAGPSAPREALPATQAMPQGSPQSMLGAQGQTPDNPTQAKANQYFNMFKNIFTSPGG